MDLKRARHYVAGAMEFLLILSAVLSAVTGAFSGARAAEPQCAPQIVAIALPSAEAEAPAARVASALPFMARVASIPMFRGFALAAAIPLYADRLIE